MKNLVIVLAVVTMAFAMSSCSSKGGSTPSDAAENYFELLKKDNDLKLEELKISYKYATATDAERKQMEAALEMKEFKVLSEKIDGETATVNIKWADGRDRDNSHTQVLSLKKHDGKWYVRGDGRNGGNVDFEYGNSEKGHKKSRRHSEKSHEDLEKEYYESLDKDWD